MNYVKTHRGFIVPGQVTNHNPDIDWYSAPGLNALVTELQSHTTSFRSWEWRADAITEIKLLFEQSPNFFAMQLSNGAPVSHRALDFMYSTLKFIQTGKRAVSIYTWMELLEYDPPLGAVNHKVQADFRDAFQELLVFPASKIIARWLQHPMGLQDLILTAWIIFGPLPEGHKGKS